MHKTHVPFLNFRNIYLDPNSRGNQCKYFQGLLGYLIIYTKFIKQNPRRLIQVALTLMSPCRVLGRDAVCTETCLGRSCWSKALGKVRTEHLPVARVGAHAPVRVRGAGLFFELPRVGSGEKKDYIREDLSSHSCHCFILHTRKGSPTEATDFVWGSPSFLFKVTHVSTSRNPGSQRHDMVNLVFSGPQSQTWTKASSENPRDPLHQADLLLCVPSGKCLGWDASSALGLQELRAKAWGWGWKGDGAIRKQGGEAWERVRDPGGPWT